MMTVMEQVCSLELSIKLEKLGVVQSSLFYWHNLDSIPSVICEHWYPERSGDFWISAFTVAELGKMIPHNLPGCYFRALKNHENNWLLSYVINDSLPNKVNIIDTEVNARARMVIYLIENNLIDKRYLNETATMEQS